MVVQIPFQVVGNLSSFWIINVNAALGLMLSQVSEMIGQIIVPPFRRRLLFCCTMIFEFEKKGLIWKCWQKRRMAIMTATHRLWNKYARLLCGVFLLLTLLGGRCPAKSENDKARARCL
jgi:hypothetical protein